MKEFPRKIMERIIDDQPFLEPEAEKKVLDKQMEIFMKLNPLPEEINIKPYNITMECSPPLRKRDIQSISEVDEENMSNLITVLDVMGE